VLLSRRVEATVPLVLLKYLLTPTAVMPTLGLLQLRRPWIKILVGSMLGLSQVGFASTTRETLYSFKGPEGAIPIAGLIQASDGNFYGTTDAGGVYGQGTIFKMSTNWIPTTLISFDGTNGSNPKAELLEATDGLFYGTTFGTATNSGTIFRLTANGRLTTLKTFGGTNGAGPMCQLIQASDGMFYGTTFSGGINTNGTVFRMTTNGVLNTLVFFTGTNGSAPAAGLVQAADGNFYGTTSGGGDNGHGTIFRMTPEGCLTTLVSFDYANGSDPRAALTIGDDGNFYGTTFAGGYYFGYDPGYGTIFRASPNGELTTLHVFGFGDRNPVAPLVKTSDGSFYGTTSTGTVQSHGIVEFPNAFRVTPTGRFSVLFEFQDTIDMGPTGGILRSRDQHYYGTTRGGGTNDKGTVYRIQSENFWIKASDGKWEEADAWSRGVRPNGTQSVGITNLGPTTISIDAETAARFPESLAAQDLLITGTNTLLLDHVGTNAPLRLLKNSRVGSPELTFTYGTTVVNLDSILLIGGPSSAGLSVDGSGQLFQDGGVIDIANTILFGGNIYVTNGLFRSRGNFELGAFFSGAVIHDGIFNQYGGTVDILLTICGGMYHLYGGNFIGAIHIGGECGAGAFTQDGGTNLAPGVSLSSYYYTHPSLKYSLNAGLLRTERIYVGYGGIFSQTAGDTVVTNEVIIEGAVTDHYPPPSPTAATLELTGGVLWAGSLILQGDSPEFVQSSGSTTISKSLQFRDAHYLRAFIGKFSLSNGTFACTDVVSEGGAVDMFQSGGSFVVSNTLSFAGYAGEFDSISTHRDPRFVRYEFSGGTLFAGNIEMNAEWIIGSASQAGRITNPGYFKLAGTLQVGDAVEQLGRFILASNSVIDLGPGDAKLSFANSSSEIWNPTAVLSVTNWSGSLHGGGKDRLKFGHHTVGLTASQLSQIRFINPANFQPGVYRAKTLPTGEVVPVFAPALTYSGAGTNLVFNWPGEFSLQTATDVSGPYQDVPAISPFTNNLAPAPQRFFRLRR
jgi:uncharacterized repeat protein (TIGR03803 family)